MSARFFDQFYILFTQLAKEKGIKLDVTKEKETTEKVLDQILTDCSFITESLYQLENIKIVLNSTIEAYKQILTRSESV